MELCPFELPKDDSTRIAEATWQRLDLAGNDHADLFQTSNGFLLSGGACFRTKSASTFVRYELVTDPEGASVDGEIISRVNGVTSIFHIHRHGQKWLLNGVEQSEVEGLLDLDFGFTPATNFMQIKRLNIEIGEQKSFTTVWFDLDSERLLPLTQVYKRLNETDYFYQSPSTSYEAILELMPNGFIKSYPSLWLSVR